MAKDGNGKWKWIGIGIIVAGILVGVGVDYANISHGVGDNKEKNTSQDADMAAIVDSIDSNENRLDECEKNIIQQTTHYGHILKAIENIEKKL